MTVAEATTSGQLRSRAKRIVDHVLTEPLQQRYERARETRNVSLFDQGGGMVFIGGLVPAVPGKAAFERITQTALGKPKDDPRTFEQYRADAFLELLLTGQAPADVHGANRVSITIGVTIPATTMLHRPDDGHGHDGQNEQGHDGHDGHDQQELFPALLDGHILVDADTIRDLAADTHTWERLFLDPVTGIPITVDTYTPTRAMKRWLCARDGTCRWPGCD